MTVYKRLYNDMKYMVEKYQDEVVPELRAKIEKMERERDALLDALRLTDADCTYCKHGEPYGEFCEICDQNDYSCSACQVADKCPCRTCTSQSKNWEWRGMRGEEPT